MFTSHGIPPLRVLMVTFGVLECDHVGINKLKDIMLTQGNGFEQKFPTKTAPHEDKDVLLRGLRHVTLLFRKLGASEIDSNQKSLGHPAFNKNLTYSATRGLSTG
jgi:hypothetical protein